jgi:4-amino-4-deoxychorismate lyase
MASLLVNGRPASTVGVADRGLLYGDGVFRTVRVRGGVPLDWSRQFRLLARDCAALDIACPDGATLREEIGRVAPADAIAKVIVTRGTGGRGYAPPDAAEPTRIVAAYPPPAGDDPAARDGVRVRRCALVLAEQPRLAGVKTLNRLENVLARAEWRDPAIREGLLGDARGRLVEGTMSNVFLATGGRLVTPDLSRCGVAGAQRERVVDLADAAGIACEIRDVDFAELHDAEEVFLTNSVIGLWPVVALDAQRWQPGPLARRLQALIGEADARGD